MKCALVIGIFSVMFSMAGFCQTRAKDYSNILGWIKDQNIGLCEGYYLQSKEDLKSAEILPTVSGSLKIKSSKSAVFKKTGESSIQGGVKLSQPGRELLVGNIDFFRDSNGRVRNAVFSDNIRMEEYGRLFVADQGNMDFIDKKYYLKGAVYKLLIDLSIGLSNVWGVAREISSEKKGELQCWDVTYSSCPPDKVAWYIWGKKLVLDFNRNKAKINNALFYLKRVPVIYMPYFSFALSKQRKSGILMPNPSYSSRSGFGIDFPYYFNLASNYDFVFTPNFLSSRGLLFKGNFRYLTKQNQGDISIKYLPRDRLFSYFRHFVSNNFKESYEMESLKNSCDYRGLLALKNKSIFGDHWTANFMINYVTDDYFFQDFSSSHDAMDNDQLPNQADIKYSGENWSFLGKLQLFQTLHPINQTRIQEQYGRLPQIKISGTFPQWWKNIDYKIDGEIVNFYRYNDKYDCSVGLADGVRVAIFQQMSTPWYWKNRVLIPMVELRGVAYGGNQTDSNGLVKLYPMFSVEGNSIFSRKMIFKGKEYRQILEPRVIYVFVPKINQDNIPLFDTYLPAFSFEQLFSNNRFVGSDRVGDTNHIAFALTTKLLNGRGHEYFSLGIGQIVSFSKHSVFIKNKRSTFNRDFLGDKYFSPLIGQLQGYLSKEVQAEVNLAWDPGRYKINYANFSIQYDRRRSCILNLWYDYSPDGDQLIQGTPVDLNRVGGSYHWRIFKNWCLVSGLDYNISYSRSQNYLCGLEYNSCCWRVRIYCSRSFIGVDGDDRKNYDSRCCLQVTFKGFSDIAVGGINSNTIFERVHGFRDIVRSGL